MRPVEFASRVIDLFTLNVGTEPAWQSIKPDTMTSAALIVALDPPQPITVSGYTFRLEADECLGLTILRATMANSLHTLMGTVAFGRDKLVANDSHAFEKWTACRSLQSRPDEVVSMLTFLTLKTNHRISIVEP